MPLSGVASDHAAISAVCGERDLTLVGTGEGPSDSSPTYLLLACLPSGRLRDAVGRTGWQL